MTGLGWLLLGGTGGVVVGMFLAASIARCFLLLGREERARYTALDPTDSAGRLPSEIDERRVGESSGRHHFVPPSDDRTDTFAPVVRPDDMLADDDSIPGKRLREFYRSRARWPDDMELAERESIAADSRFERTADAADRGGHQ